MSPRGRDALIFAIGAVTGFAVAALLFEKRNRDVNNEVTGTDISEEQPTIEAEGQMQIEFEPEQANTPSNNPIRYDEIIKRLRYSGQEERLEDSEEAATDNIFRIREDEYYEGARNGYYDTESYTFYADGVLANSITDDIVDEPAAIRTIGLDGLTESLKRSFLNCEEPIYIRNNETYTQYEILYDDHSYGEVTGR